jgi:hypothetical protein
MTPVPGNLEKALKAIRRTQRVGIASENRALPVIENCARRAGASLMRGDPDRVTPSIRSRTGALFALVLAAELALTVTVGASEPDIARRAVDPSRRVPQAFVAQSADPAARLTTKQRIRNPCPPGHRIKLAFGDTSLLIDPEWMKSGR